MSIETDSAWAAGFWDGEGSCGFYMSSRYNTGRLQMQITQKHREVLDRFYGIVQQGRVYERELTGTRTTKYNWMSWQTGAFISVSTLLWPYLGIIKQDQIRRAWRSHNDFHLLGPGHGQRGSYPFDDYLDEEVPRSI